MKDKIMIATKYTVKIVAFLVLLVLLNKGLAYLVAHDSNTRARYMMHDFYETDDVDVLFLGSSHVYCSLDPFTFMALGGENSFNAGSSAQSIDVSFALLKEYTKSNTLEKVYFECYYDVVDTTSFDGRSDDTWGMGTVYTITDYMPFSFNKVQLLLNASSPVYYANNFIPAKRYWKTLFVPSDLVTIYQAKQTETYKFFTVQTDQGGYVGKGFAITYKQLEEYEAVDPIDLSTYVPSDDWLNTFYEMYEYCKANDIELVLYSATMPVETLSSSDYDIYIQQVYRIIEGTDLTYVDFNLAKEDLLITEPSDFSDDDHLNYYGAQKFTEAFYKVYYELENPEDYFYDSFYEKLADMYPEYLEEVN